MITKDQIEAILDTVYDPEIPVLSVMDMGIIRDIQCSQDEVQVKITPTYTGCPAMHLIEMNIKAALEQQGLKTSVETILSPAWTTDWMTEKGKQNLKNYGIAPPHGKYILNPEAFAETRTVACPRCGSSHTEKISEFGSTACKALYRCLDCREPFDYFKCH